MSYTKGTRGERELLSMFYDEGFVGFRAPSSGSTTDRELPDVLVGDGKKTYAIESKRADEGPVYLPHEEVEDLSFFSLMFGADALVAFREDYGDWNFWKPNELYSTGNSFRVRNEEEARKFTEIT